MLLKLRYELDSNPTLSARFLSTYVTVNRPPDLGVCLGHFVCTSNAFLPHMQPELWYASVARPHCRGSHLQFVGIFAAHKILQNNYGLARVNSWVCAGRLFAWRAPAL
jgi:hypothetical protein